MSLELALTAGLIGAAYMTLQTSEKLKKTEEEVATTIIALSYLPVIGVFFGGWKMASNASMPGMTDVYIAALLVGSVIYLVFLYLLVKTYYKRAEDEGLQGL